MTDATTAVAPAAPSPAPTAPTRGALMNAEIAALLKARHTLICIRTREDVRVERACIDSGATIALQTEFWDCAKGLSDAAGKPLDGLLKNPSKMIERIDQNLNRRLYVMRDMHAWWKIPTDQRALKSLARSLQVRPIDQASAVIVLCPEGTEIPPELSGCMTVLDYPMPDRAEIAQLLTDAIAGLPEKNSKGEPVRAVAAPNGVFEKAVDAALGQSGEEAANCFLKSLVTTRRIDPVIVANEKKRVIARDGLLEWFEGHPRGLDAIGGNRYVKEWILRRGVAFSPRARAFGIPAPRGLFLIGISGGGKSYTCKCVPTAWGIPGIRMDCGALMSKYVGESEQNAKRAFRLAETIAPCVLQIDEVEKALAGSTGEQGDGGVNSRFLGAFLTWRQECTAPVFVIATANDPSRLPPEFIGRFEAMFFVDLPTAADRAEIITQALKDYRREISPADARLVADATRSFTGREIANLIPDALLDAFSDGERPLTAADLCKAAADVVPLSVTSAGPIDNLRKWAKGRARLASPTEDEVASTGRAINLD